MTLRNWLIATVCVASGWSSTGCNTLTGLDKKYTEPDCYPPGTCADASAAGDATADVGPGDSSAEAKGSEAQPPPDSSSAGNPCAANHGGCAANAVCTVIDAGARTCTCNPGFAGDGLTCTSVDSCTTGNGGCSVQATCMSQDAGIRTCVCKQGYAGDGVTCAPIDACTTSNGGCSTNAKCTSTGANARTCACNTGYSGDGLTCTSINSCLTSNGGCSANATCTPSGPGTNTCMCNSGYNGDGVTCVGVQACATNNGGCAATAKCTSTGANTRTCACNTGYTGDGLTCTEVNSCLTGNGGCSSNALCTSTGAGTNTCACNTGYTGNGMTCTPVNVCLTGNGGCAAGSTCVYAGPGTRTCNCMGAASGPCAYCGTQTRSCDTTTGTWSAWSLTCSGVCAANTTGACDVQGLRTCSPSCTWDACIQPSCQGGGNGAGLNCGPNLTDDCCASPTVTGGTFNRGSDANNPSTANPATVSTFRLDTYPVTVGRFRKFVNAWDAPAPWRPADGSGKHTHVNGGAGLAAADLPGVTNEPGWSSSYNTMLATNLTDWTTNLTSSASPTWTSTPGLERLPITEANWYEAYAFCIWDGGFLPSDAEWLLAASGGSDSLGQRVYPWSVPSTQTTIDCTYANYAGSDAACRNPPSVTNVGSFPVSRNGRFGQADLGGNVAQWTMDYAIGFPANCTNCYEATTQCAGSGGCAGKVIRGGSFSSPATDLQPGLASNVFIGVSPSQRSYSGTADVGFRCARVFPVP